MGHVARIYKTSNVGQDLAMDYTIVLFIKVGSARSRSAIFRGIQLFSQPRSL